MLIYLQIIETPQDKSKFEAIYEEYYGLMYHTAYKYLKHEQDAEDAVHHAFVKIAENIKIVEPVSPKTKQFVVTIVENRVIDVFRVRSKHPEVSFMEELYIVPEQPENDNFLKQCIIRKILLRRNCMKQLIVGTGMIVLGYLGLSTQRIIDAVYMIGEIQLSSSTDVFSTVNYLIVLLGVLLCIIGWKKS